MIFGEFSGARLAPMFPVSSGIQKTDPLFVIIIKKIFFSGKQEIKTAAFPADNSRACLAASESDIRELIMNKKAEELCEACSKGDLKAVIGLLNGSFFSKGVPPDVMSDNWDGMFGGMTPLMCASMYGKTEVAEYLLSHGADVNIIQPKGKNTALIYAAANKHTDIVKVLLQNKADITSKNANGRTAPQIAAELALPEMLSLFDNADADLFGGLQALLMEARDWGSNNKFPLGKAYPQYNGVREIGIAAYKKKGSKGLHELMAQVKEDGSDLYTYLDLLWNHLKVGDEEVWLM